MNWETSKKPLVLAHRGFAQTEVENSLEAVAAAIKLGVDGVEVDLRMTADGEIVVFHDDTLKRLADRKEKIEELTSSGIRKVLLQGKSRLPTLEELLDLVGDKILLNLEIKTVRPWGTKLEQKLVETLRSFHLKESILISSFHPIPLRRLKKIDPELKRGYLVSDLYFRTRRRNLFSKMIQPFSLHPSLGMTDEALTAKVHEAGGRIFVWTVNNEDDIKRMIRIGVDGIFSDRPDRCLDWAR